MNAANPNVESAANSAANVWRTTQNVLLDAIFPPRCAGCHTWSKSLFCMACRKGLVPIVTPFCRVCGLPFDVLTKFEVCAGCRANRDQNEASFRIARAAFLHEGPLREAVHRFKYKGKIALAAPLAGLLYQNFGRLQQQSLPLDSLALLVPVPLHPKRLRARGYNQSELLARELAHLCGVPHANVLRRTRHTPPQVGLRARERQENVQGAFAVEAGELRRVNPHLGPILLLDDVCTTGSTLRECARQLHQSGAREVYALTLARQL